MPIIISQTPVFGLVSVISCSSLSGRFSSVLCIWRSSSLWLEAGSLALLLTLCCMSHIVLRYRTISLICCFSLFVTWVFWLAAAAALTQSLGGALDCHTQTEFVYCGHLNALSGFAWLIWFVFFPLPTLSHKQVDNRLQGSVDFRVSFRNNPSHNGSETRRRGCWPHG